MDICESLSLRVYKRNQMEPFVRSQSEINPFSYSVDSGPRDESKKMGVCGLTHIKQGVREIQKVEND